MPKLNHFLKGLGRRKRPTASAKDKAENAQKRAVGVHNIFWQAWDLLDPQYPENPWYDIVDIFVDEGALFLIVNADGKLFRHTIDIENDTISISEGIEVMQSFTPLARQMSVTRQDDGRVRVTQIVASSVLNRNSQIDSTELFDNFIRRAEETGEYPAIDFIHYNDVKLGQADFLARAGFCYIASWLFDDTEVGRAAGESFLNDSEDYWGASIQFTPLEAQMVTVAEDVEVLTFVDGINTFISVLPENCAANLFTARKVEGVVKNMNDADFERLVKLLGGNVELARQVSEMATSVNGQIAAGNMIARQSGEDGGETAATDANENATDTDESATDTDAAAGFDVDEALVVEIANAIVTSEEFRTTLSGMLPELPELPEDMVSRSALDEVVVSIGELREAIVGRLDVLEAMNIAAAAQWSADRPRDSRGAPQPISGRRQLRFRPRTARDPDNAGDGNPAGNSEEYITQITDSRPPSASY